MTLGPLGFAAIVWIPIIVVAIIFGYQVMTIHTDLTADDIVSDDHDH